MSKMKNIPNNLTKWDLSEDSLAPLTDYQKECLLNLEEELFPDNNLKTEEANGTACTSKETMRSVQIERCQDLLKHYATLEKKCMDRKDMKYMLYLNELQTRRQECQELCLQIEGALEDFNMLYKQYSEVSDKTISLYDASEQLDSDQRKLNSTIENITEYVKYFKDIDMMMEKLEAPTLSVNSEMFFNILDKIDTNIDFVQNNLSFKESNTYLIKYKHCQSKAISMIQNYIFNLFSKTTESILNLKDNDESQDNADAALALFYGRFQTILSKARPVIEQIEAKSYKRQEYDSLLSECHQCYWSQRGLVLGSSVQKSLMSVKEKYNGDHMIKKDHKIMHGNSALHEATWRGYSRTATALAKALGTQRAPLHARNLAGFAPLHLACQNGHNQSCRELLLAGCNPDLQNNYGDTPLHTSARYGHAGVTRILISALCRVSDQNKNGDTALHIAAAMGRRKLTRILLEAGCDRSLRNKQGETAKDIARRKNLQEILEIIGKARSKSRTRSKSREEDSTPATVDKVDGKSSSKNEKKREKTGSGTSGSRDSCTKKEKKKHKSFGKQNKVHFEKAVMGRQWSPYGCHYYPDPEAFPQPRLDSLPPDPLGRGEQYYLDLAGNIRKGPVGVGYTCYCAPFFRHMEAKLERDKAELKAHIDQAHERLDLKVANLERRTRGQITELTRCVAAERSRCDERHMHLQQRLSRGGKGRHSERPVKTTLANDQPFPPTRARSLEDLLDDRPHDRSFEIPGETPIHRGSLDDLDIPAIPRLSKSMRDLPSGSGVSRSTLRVLDVPARLNETFDGVIKQDRSSPLGAASSPSIGSRQQVHQQRDLTSRDHGKNSCQNESNATRKNEDTSNEWKSSGRRSVHEMIKRFQQVPGMHNGWRGPRSGSSEPTSPEHSQCSQNQRVQPQGGVGNSWRGEGNDSESSEGDDEQPEALSGGISGKGGMSEHVHYDSIARMPYRSRNAVYSPTPPLHDAHNDSGYSTRMYGSSKGASPSLSGQLECDVILPTTPNAFPSGEQLAALLEQPRNHDLTVYERGADNCVINIGTASLV